MAFDKHSINLVLFSLFICTHVYSIGVCAGVQIITAPGQRYCNMWIRERRQKVKGFDFSFVLWLITSQLSY